MEDEATEVKKAMKRGGGGAAVLAVVMVGLVFLPLLYTLSIGPVIVMVDRDWIGKEWMPALEAKAEVSAPTTHNSSPVTSGVLNPAIPRPTASTVP